MRGRRDQLCWGWMEDEALGGRGEVDWSRLGGARRGRRRECFTAVSLDFCTTHQNSAACRQEEQGGRADASSVLSIGTLPLTVCFVLFR